MNKEIGRRIRQKRLERNMTMKDLAGMVGVASSTILRYENGEIGAIKLPVIESIAKALNVNPAWLVLKSEIESPDILTYKTKKVPMLGEIAAGEPMLVAEQMAEYYVEVDEELQVDFCLKVKGDSMKDARINDGDVVFIRKQPTVENGEIAAVIIDDEVTLKRFYRNDGLIMLKPENSKYQPLMYQAKDFKEVRILGKAVMFQSKL